MTNKPTRLLITPSLLNSWLYIDLCRASVKEAETDTICLEDKQDQASQKAFEAFKATLQRIKTPPTPAMQRGIEFEDLCCKGNQPQISPIIEGGAFQIVGTREETIQGIDFLLYGRLDVLKNGIIYDIKRVSQYKTQKYAHSAQHGFYMDLFENATQFTYLAYDNYDKLHKETYYRDQYKPTTALISEFIGFLKQNNLWDTYVELWASKH